MPQEISRADPPARIETEQCQMLGERLRDLTDRSMRRRQVAVLLGLGPEEDQTKLVDYYFYLSALLFDFRGFDTVIDGQLRSGADAYFALAARRAAADPAFFVAARLISVDAAALQAVFSASGRPEDCLLRRCDERAALLRDAAGHLLQDFGGSAMSLLDATGGKLRRSDGRGLIDLLDAFAGYHDPHFKKGFVLVKALEALGVWRAVDREHLYIPVDYHRMRVALRAGIIETVPEVTHLLRERRPASDELDMALREVVKLAYKEVERAASLDIFTLDELFWTLGRSCCHYAWAPRCHVCDYTRCTVMRSFAYECPGQCPLGGVCRGSREPSYAELYETNIKTVFY